MQWGLMHRETTFVCGESTREREKTRDENEICASATDEAFLVLSMGAGVMF